jgi:hypothetical protein
MSKHEFLNPKFLNNIKNSNFITLNLGHSNYLEFRYSDFEFYWESYDTNP